MAWWHCMASGIFVKTSFCNELVPSLAFSLAKWVLACFNFESSIGNDYLTIMAWWCHMAFEILVKTSSCNGLLPDDTKPLPEPMLTYHQYCPMAFTWGHYHKKIWRDQSGKEDTSIYLRNQWVNQIWNNVCTHVANCLCAHKRVIILTLEWAHKQFVTRVHTLFYFLHDITNA